MRKTDYDGTLDEREALTNRPDLAATTIPKPKAKNPFGKTVKRDQAYAVYSNGSWTWYVLKLYKSPEASLKDPYSRAFTLVTSPFTGSSGELGDTYVREIGGMLVEGVDVRAGKSE